MKSLRLFMVAALFASSPALATGGFDCRTTDGLDIGVSGVVGHVVGNPLVAARLRLGEQLLSTTGEQPRIAVAQSWIDAREIRLDLVDAEASRYEARLRARIMIRLDATGTLLRHGRTHPVRCTIE